jgi:acetoin utilization deacetylase AcuC-like enzyme
MRPLVLTHPDCLEHLRGISHPEAPQRLEVVLSTIQDCFGSQVDFQHPKVLDGAAIDTVHEPSFWPTILEKVRRHALFLDEGDTLVSPGSIRAALAAAGASVAAAHAVIEGRSRIFVATRPPGHHATPARPMGFCYVNHMALGVRYLQKSGIQRCLIIDWDVHHGNGTQDFFYREEEVFYYSVHQSPWYPGTGTPEEQGEGAGEGRTLNRAMPSGTTSFQWLKTFERDLPTLIKAFRPQILLISAGFDGHRLDPLGEFLLETKVFGELTHLVDELAKSNGNLPIISLLEGGYHLQALKESVTSHLAALFT